MEPKALARRLAPLSISDWLLMAHCIILFEGDDIQRPDHQVRVRADSVRANDPSFLFGKDI